MSLSTAINSATSGLRAVSRAAELVAGNIANASTPGYARRDVLLSANPLGGVSIDGFSRATDPFLIADRRLSEAAYGSTRVLADGLGAIEGVIGDPTEEGSLLSRVARLETSLADAATRPDLESRLAEVRNAAADLTAGIAGISREIQEQRALADTNIGTMVERLNESLKRVEDLNIEILRVGQKGVVATGLIEQRQQVIDQITEIVPIREVPRQDGQIALFTDGGAVLLEGKAREIGFSPKGFVEPWMSLAGGALSGLTIGDTEIDTTATRSLIGGGALQASFDMRDRVAPEAQASLDALARDLIERFQDPSLDPSLAVGDAGLFTDGGAAFDPLNEEGLSLRMELNSAVDPSNGGQLWRLRDGIGAIAEGPPGNNALLVALTDRLGEARVPATGPSAGQSRSFEAQATAFLTGISSERQWRESDLAFGAARLEGTRTEEAIGGVDTDDEMQKLLLIEQNYGANARVLQTLDTLLEQLLSIT
ncbi:MAG: flagellar hook-associated protein FlgK [Pseudomonadota bacterium]